jgi:Ca2+-binding EF-hand superfamily protein
MKMRLRKRLAKKNQILNDLEESIKWIKLYQEGKVKAKPIRELLNELDNDVNNERLQSAIDEMNSGVYYKHDMIKINV